MNIVKFYAVQIALGVGYLHSKGLMHRDIKSENVLIDSDGYLKIIDFGLAKQIIDGKESLEKTAGRGTPGYMSPEVSTTGKYSYDADWWSVGCLLYFIAFN